MLPDALGNRIYLSDRNLGLGGFRDHLIGQVLQEFDAYPLRHPDRGRESMVGGQVAGAQVGLAGVPANAPMTSRQPASAF